MGELKELRLAYAECSKQRNELLNKLKSQPKREWVSLTEEEKRLFASWLDDKTDDEVFNGIEAALRSKNT
jgi:hypothetical protein